MKPEVARSMDAKVYSANDLKQHTEVGNLWLAIDGGVYDLSNFTDRHPGGEEVLLKNSGTDATNAFEEIGHSEKAIDLMKKFYVGKFDVETSVDSGKNAAKIGPGMSSKYVATQTNANKGISQKLAASVAIAAICAIYYLYITSKSN